MKLSKLLVLSAMGLVSLSANAADLVERTTPSAKVALTQAEAFQADKEYVLYNIGSKMFFAQGGAWGTKASVNPDYALRVKLTEYGDSLNPWDGATYIFNDYCSQRNDVFKWHECFFDSETAMFVDRATQANYFWEIQDMGDNVYRLKAGALNPTLQSDGTQFVGYDPNVPQDGDNLSDFYDNANTYPLSPMLTEGYIDWQFYDAAPYVAAQEVFAKSKELKAIIEKGEEKGIDVNAAVDVYNNLNSTLQQIEDAIKALQDAISGNIAKGTPDNPSDATELMVNPNFDNASYTGWSGTAPNMTGSGAHGPANVAEHYNKTFDTYQELTGMPEGVYGLNASTFFRGSWDDHANKKNYVAFLYATSGEETEQNAFDNPWDALNTIPMAGSTSWGVNAAEGSEIHDGVTYYIPNDPSCGRLYFEKGYYQNAVIFTVGADGAARIGVKKDTKVTDTDWAVFDSFRLTYFGNEPASFGAWVADNAKGLYAKTNNVTLKYESDFFAAVAAAKASATDKATAKQALEEVKNSQQLADLKQNISLWQKLMKLVEEGNAMAQDSRYSYLDAAGILGDYCGLNFEDIVAEMSLNNDELEAEIDKVQKMIDDLIEEYMAQYKPGDDVTDNFIKNADFAKGKDGWTLEGNCNAGSGALEAYNQKFDLYQTINNAQVGVYELQLQGFFRLERDQTAFNMYQNGEQDPTRAWIYVNSNKTYVKCVFDEPAHGGYLADSTKYTQSGCWINGSDPAESDWYANTMGTAAEAFKAGMYKVSAYGLIAEKGDPFRVGVAGDMSGANWMIWDNFKLIFRGNEPSVIKPILEEAIKSINTSENMGKSIYGKAELVKKQAQDALNNEDGDAMFQALKDIYALRDEITTSVALFKELKAALNELSAAMKTYSESPKIGEAAILLSEIEENIDIHEYEDEDVPGLLKQISDMILALALPDDYTNASDLEPKDLTAFIKTPGFAKQGKNSIDGWTTDGYNFGNDDTQKGAQALEFFNKTFDIHQTIEGLPEGLYKVTVDAFCRVGGIAEDYAAWLENNDATEAFVYAYDSDSLVSSKPVACLFKGAQTTDPSFSGQSEYLPSEDSEVTYYIPNDMVSAVAFFNMEGSPYTTEVLVKVKEDGKLTIGMIKSTNSANGWVLLDNWTLTYFGKDSALSPDEDAYQGIDDLESMPAVKAELFTIDGRRANAAQKGFVIVKKTMADGSVVVKKIRK